jgi:hypothetical protein
MQLGHNPIVAGNAAQLEIIRAAFPDGIATTPLDGYNVSYSSWNRFLQMGLLTQIPGLLRTIQQEHHWLKEKADQLKLDGVISDNRYGLFHTAVPTVILTHQLRIQTGLGTIADNLVQRRHYKFLNRFGKVWVVDTPDGPGLAGILSHPAALPDNACYTGLLSRLAGTKTEVAPGVPKKPCWYCYLARSHSAPGFHRYFGNRCSRMQEKWCMLRDPFQQQPLHIFHRTSVITKDWMIPNLTQR